MITKILNDEERKMFNKIYEIKSEIVFIKNQAIDTMLKSTILSTSD